MKSPKVKGIGEVVTEYGAKVMKVIKKGLLGRSLFDFYGDVKANAIRVKESSSVPQTPNDKDGGIVYVKSSDGKLYYKSNEVSEVELSALLPPDLTAIKILPRDFIADDSGSPVQIDDTGSDRWIESDSTSPLYASVEIPPGFKATHVDIYGSATSAVTVYEANINARAVTSKGTGNIGTQINITDVTSDATNYLLIELAQASGEQVNGGKVTIAKA